MRKAEKRGWEGRKREGVARKKATARGFGLRDGDARRPRYMTKQKPNYWDGERARCGAACAQKRVRYEIELPREEADFYVLRMRLNHTRSSVEYWRGMRSSALRKLCTSCVPTRMNNIGVL